MARQGATTAWSRRGPPQPGSRVGSTPEVEIAAIHALRSDQSAAVSWLERAYDRDYREDLSLRLNPKLRNLRSHPSFLKLLEKIKDEKARIARESPEFQELFEKVVPNLPPPPKRIYP